MPKTLIGEVEYYYQEAGRGEPALLLHGFTGSSQSWTGIMPALEMNFRLIAVDLLGHGKSSAPEDPMCYRMEKAAEDLVLLLDQIASRPIHLLGYSMGGRLALYFALAYPERVRTLVLISASPGIMDEDERKARQKADEALAARIEREGIEAFVTEWEKLPIFTSQDNLSAAARRELRSQRLQNRPAGLAGSLRGMGSGVHPSLWGRLQELKPKTLLITGELDSKFCRLNEEMVRAIPGASLRRVPGAGHAVYLEQPEQTVEIVERFWMDGGDR